MLKSSRFTCFSSNSLGRKNILIVEPLLSPVQDQIKIHAFYYVPEIEEQTKTEITLVLY